MGKIMGKILALLGIVLILAVPVLADINQNARATGRNMMEVKVDQIAWNYGHGDINQDVNIHVTGNYQLLDQESRVIISDSDYDTDINNTQKGLNFIIVDLNQYGNNTGSGDIAQGINVLIDDNVQTVDQDVRVLIS